MNILFVVPYPRGSAPGQRFRFELYLDYLSENNIRYTIRPFIDEQTNSILYSPGNKIKKATGILNGFLRRCSDLFHISKYDYVYIFREASPVGLPFFEWICSKILKIKLIYDFDDAIWLSDPNESWFMSLIKFKSKTRYICKWSWRVTCGNDFLFRFASKYNPQALIIPTVVDTKIHRRSPQVRQDNSMIIGWTGTHSTLVYLETIIPVLRGLSNQFDFKFRVIANRKPEFTDSFIEFIPWNKETEIDDLQTFDIGLMPLTDDKWSEGKCGFKIIQYLALEIPAVASPVGVNKKLITNNETGFLCNTEEEWYQSLTTLISNPELRARMGKTGREKIIREYSKSATADVFVSLFRE